MECVGCGSATVSERSERTAQGYRRFRCRACGKQFNERSAGILNRTQYPAMSSPSWCSGVCAISFPCAIFRRCS
jgi:transposase-like protein